MGDRCQAAVDVIAIEDDDEDVEVVFSNLENTSVHRNLMYQKISQEIELLQAMNKHIMPTKFDTFRELARKLGFQYRDSVIQSAWQRVMKKHLIKVKDLQSSKTPICLVRPLQPPITVSPPHVDFPASSFHAPNKVPSPSKTSEAVPIALLLNQTIQVGHSPQPKVEGSVKCFEINSIPGSYIDKEDKQFGRCSNDEQSFQELDSTLIKAGVTRGCKRKSSDNNNSKKCKSEKDIFNTNLDLQCLSKGGSEESAKGKAHCSDLFEKNVSSYVSELNQLIVNKNVTHNSSQKQSSSKQVEVVNSQNIVAKSHVGVKAKIVRTKNGGLPRSGKKQSGEIKEMSEAELKQFKAKQKILKHEQKLDLEMKQLQKVHDRLVDVLIPKYYKKDLNDRR